MARLSFLLMIFFTTWLNCSTRHDKIADQIQNYVVKSDIARAFIQERSSKAVPKNVIGLHPYYIITGFSHLSKLDEENKFIFGTGYDSSSIDSLLQEKSDIRIDTNTSLPKKRFTIYLTPPFKGICYAILVDVEDTWISSLGNSMSPVSGVWLEFLFEVKDGKIKNLHEGERYYIN